MSRVDPSFTVGLTMEQVKYLLSPLPVSGGCTMCHIVGITPEAATLDQALMGNGPVETISVSKQDIQDIFQKLTSAEGNQVDLVILGCPHLTIRELKNTANTLEGRKIHGSVRLMIGTSKPIHALAEAAGFVNTIEQAGGEFVDICISVGNPLVYLSGLKVIMTDLSRAAHYIQRMTDGKVQTVYADSQACLEAAIAGRVQ